MNKNICLIGLFGVLTLAFAIDSKAQCTCVCKFPKSKQLVLSGKQAASVGTQYSFRPNFFRDCTGAFCIVSAVDYAWTVGTASTASFTVEGGLNLPELVVVVTSSGKLELTCTVTVTCGDKTTKCRADGTRTFRLSQ